MAISLWNTGNTKRNRNLVFIEHLFVRPEFRERGVGAALLWAASGRCVSRVDPWAHRVGLVVRKHSAQQAAARRLYDRCFLRPRALRKKMKPFVDEPTSFEPIVPQPGVEEYREGAAGHQPRPFVTPCAIDGTHDLEVSLGVQMPREELVRDVRIMKELRLHHAKRNGGDGSDPVKIISNADSIVPALAYPR